MYIILTLKNYVIGNSVYLRVNFLRTRKVLQLGVDDVRVERVVLDFSHETSIA